MLSGIFGAHEVNGAARFGVYAFVKHFAANDQETNRCAFLLTYLTEQTLRENCLKPFEMVVKNFDYENNVLGMMSSCNWLGSSPVASNYDLLTTVLREEWGFVGTVISDYDGSYGYMISEASVRAGNDLMLGYGMAESNRFNDLEAATSVLALRKACKNILYTVGNSGYYADAATAQDTGMSNMTRLFIAVDVGTAVLCLGTVAIVVAYWLGKCRKKADIQIMED